MCVWGGEGKELEVKSTLPSKGVCRSTVYQVSEYTIIALLKKKLGGGGGGGILPP